MKGPRATKFAQALTVGNGVFSHSSSATAWTTALEKGRVVPRVQGSAVGAGEFATIWLGDKLLLAWEDGLYPVPVGFSGHVAVKAARAALLD